MRLLYTIALSFVLGGLSALAMPPTHIWPLLIIGISGLYYLLSLAQTKKRAFLTGFFWGYGYFVCGMYWIGNALLVDGNEFIWAWPLAVFGFQASLALFTAFGCLIAYLICNFKHWSALFGFAACLMFSEWARGHFFTGFPWNLYGYTWAKYETLLQILRYSNVYYLTLITILWALIPASLYLYRKKSLPLLSIAAILLSTLLTYGFTTLKNANNTTRENLVFQTIQPNIPQSEKWNPVFEQAHFRQTLDLMVPSNIPDQTTYILFPETAFKSWVLEDPYFKNQMLNKLSSYKGNAYIMTGILLHNQEKDTYANAFYMMDKQGNISNLYKKHHLVPFGEYMPFQKYIPIKPVAEFQSFDKGEKLEVFSTPENLNYTPLICYEIIFPDKIKYEDLKKKPDFAVNVTNDAWYGISPGPYQHMVMAQYRAIETGIPVFRSANTGISGGFDTYGRVLEKTRLYKNDSVTMKIPKANPAIYILYQYKNYMLLGIICFFGILSYIHKGRFSKKNF